MGNLIKKNIDTDVFISCIIATHNRDKYLIESINSILSQTKSPLEIIVSDNLPNKKTRKIVNDMAALSNVPLHYIGHEYEGRGCISRNLAVYKAKGNYIAFLDDDDVWLSEYLENITYLITETKKKIIYTWLIDWCGGKDNIGKQVRPNLSIGKFLLRNPGTTISNLVVNRDLFVAIGGFDEYIHPSYDKDFIIRALYFGYSYAVLEKHLVKMRRDDHNRESAINRDFVTGMKKFFNKHRYHANLLIKCKFLFKCLRLNFAVLASEYFQK